MPVLQASNISTSIPDPTQWANVVTVGGATVMPFGGDCSAWGTACTTYTNDGLTFTTWGTDTGDIKQVDGALMIRNRWQYPQNLQWNNWGNDTNFMKDDAQNTQKYTGQYVQIDFAASTAFAIYIGTGTDTGRGQQVTLKLSNGDVYVLNTGQNGTATMQFIGFTSPSPIHWVELMTPTNNNLVFTNAQFGTLNQGCTSNCGGGDPPPGGDTFEISTLLMCASGLLFVSKVGHRLRMSAK